MDATDDHQRFMEMRTKLLTEDCCRKCHCTAFKKQIKSRCRRGKVRLVRTSVKRCRLPRCGAKKCDRIRFFRNYDAPFKRQEPPKLYNFEPMRKPTKCKSTKRCEKKKSCKRNFGTCQKVLKKCAPDFTKSETFANISRQSLIQPSSRSEPKPKRSNSAEYFQSHIKRHEQKGPKTSRNSLLSVPESLSNTGSNYNSDMQLFHSDDEARFNNDMKLLHSDDGARFNKSYENNCAYNRPSQNCFQNILQDLKADIADIDNILLKKRVGPLANKQDRNHPGYEFEQQYDEPRNFARYFNQDYAQSCGKCLPKTEKLKRAFEDCIQDMDDEDQKIFNNHIDKRNCNQKKNITSISTNKWNKKNIICENKDFNLGQKEVPNTADKHRITIRANIDLKKIQNTIEKNNLNDMKNVERGCTNKTKSRLERSNKKDKSETQSKPTIGTEACEDEESDEEEEECEEEEEESMCNEN
ncbi:hypothetical protein M8J76_011106 [Diaphorina citri]|jgi:hypothetical protein|nr:hypothetical protein M8J75_015822 [Diaphorina citri]KAI5722622.1 hypothetical protein M8J76_011106 [Diaphorina citri]KAI5725182.1 hypothetical protein M8J77_012192 [Diaphorina citri]